MIPQEADQTHIEYGFPVGRRAKVYTSMAKSFPRWMDDPTFESEWPG